jgi:adenylate kinase
MKTANVIGVFGLSGVGKTRMIRAAIHERDGIVHLQAGALIKQGLADATISSEALRRSSGDRVLANQSVLLAMFAKVLAAEAGKLVIFDGHLIIDTDADLVEIPLGVVTGLQPAALLHVEALPEIIAARRREDNERIRPARTKAVLVEHQARSRKACCQFAAALGIDAHIVTNDSPAVLSKLCSRLLDDGS